MDELGSALSPDLREELDRLAFPFAEEGTPSEVELRVAQAQLVGWLEGLFHGIQATLFAQQMAARQQLENMRWAAAAGHGPPGPGRGPVPPRSDRAPTSEPVPGSPPAAPGGLPPGGRERVSADLGDLVPW